MESLRNDNAECAVLQLLMNHSKLFLEINGRITEKDFYSRSHQLIFKALSKMFDNNEPIDLVTLTAKLDKMGSLNAVGGTLAITNLNNVFAIKSSFQKDVDIVREMSHRRFLWQLGKNIQEEVLDPTQDITEIESRITTDLTTLNVEAHTQVAEIKDIMVGAFDSIFSDNNFGLLTKYFELDRYTRGFSGGDLIVLAARPSMGKTALALNIVTNVCKQDKSVLMVSLEMSNNDLAKRALYAEAKESSYSISNKKNTSEFDKVFNKITSKADEISKWKLGVIESGRLSVEELAQEARLRQRTVGLDLIVIDYLQLMSAKGFRNEREKEIAHISRQLKLLAKELNIPILLLSQLNRSVEARQNKRPMMSDMRESGAIEQDADKVLLLYRDNYYNDPADPWTELIIGKNRGGAVGTIKLDFIPEYTLFTDWNENQPSGKEVKVF